MNNITQDMKMAFMGKSGIIPFIRGFLIDTGFKSVVYYRIANYLFRKKIPYISNLIASHSIAKTAADIRPPADIGPGLVIKHSVGVVIGNGVIIGDNCTILQNVTLGEKYSQDGTHLYPKIGNNVTICAGAVILGAVEIANNAIIGANSVVIRNVYENEIVAGAPARKVGDNHLGNDH
jgi:serine O-acetyltransferase